MRNIVSFAVILVLALLFVGRFKSISRESRWVRLSVLVRPLRGAILLLVLGHIANSSLFYVGQFETGHVIKRLGGQELPSGQIIAVNGENGPQSQIYQ